MVTLLGKIFKNSRLLGNALATSAHRTGPLVNKISKAGAFNESGAYDGDGRTTATVLQNSQGEAMNLISSYSTLGFRLSNRIFASGSIILFPTSVFSWRLKESKEINLDSLILFDLVLPKIKMLVIGYGDYGDGYDSSIPMKLKQKGISCEMQPTCHAVTTYNYLAADAVHVAGAFIPPRSVSLSQKDYGESSLHDFMNEPEYMDKLVERETPQKVRNYIDSNKNKFKY